MGGGDGCEEKSRGEIGEGIFVAGELARARIIGVDRSGVAGDNMRSTGADNVDKKLDREQADRVMGILEVILTLYIVM